MSRRDAPKTVAAEETTSKEDARAKTRRARQAWAIGALAWATAGLLGVFLGLTEAALRPISHPLPSLGREASVASVVDRDGVRLSASYSHDWNEHDRVSLHAIPPFLIQALVEAEDRRFFEHRGVDGRARLAAAVENMLSGRTVRGASTISEQVVRLLQPRPRTLWSRWLEGMEAMALERTHSKGEILEFYLNQVPYARNRRGVVQAARDLFDRDLDTLGPGEMIVLAVLPRAPSRLDPRRSGGRGLAGAVDRLADHMVRRGDLTDEARREIAVDALDLAPPSLEVVAPHFLRYVRGRAELAKRGVLATTLDGSLQKKIEEILNRRVAAMATSKVRHGAALVVDHRKNEILAWVSGGAASEIDAVLAFRQPGSTLKPFLYGLALERGMTAATLLDDRPMRAAVGAGLHRYRNYSRRHSGLIRLREALGNSLNVPAVRLMESFPADALLEQLRRLGFRNLSEHPEHYGAGLALGVGEVNLFELVQAYAVLARSGRHQRIEVQSQSVSLGPPPPESVRVMPEEVASLIGDILSDPDARAMEFDRDGVLHFPVQTAVKTGTSSDYRDAWALGFSDRYTAGVWFGNLDRGEMLGVTGSTGPALVLRSIFAELEDPLGASPLPLSKSLRSVPICAESGRLARAQCPVIDEWFRSGKAPKTPCPLHGAQPAPVQTASSAPSGAADQGAVRLVRPVPGLHLALDPRIPDALERFAMEVETTRSVRRIDWIIDGRMAARVEGGRRQWLWSPSRGVHTAAVRATFADAEPGSRPIESETVRFEVR